MTQDNQTNFRPLPVILMVLVLAGVAFGGWWIKNQPPTPVLNTAGTVPLPSNNTPSNAEDVALTLFIPNDNAMLERHTVTGASPSTHFTDLAKSAFSLLLQKAPESFPAGTQLLNVTTNPDRTAILNFNSQFTEPSFWQGSARTMMTTYSIVNTITALPADDFSAQQVQFQVEGEPLVVLGELDVQDPLKPEMQWVQKN